MTDALNERVLIIGTGDHGRVILDLVRATGRFAVGMIEPSPQVRWPEVEGCPVLGTLDGPDAWRDAARGTGFVVALGDNAARAAAFDRGLELGLRPVAVVHPSAIVLGGARIEDGAQVCAAAIVGVGAVVGADAIVNTAASLDHDVIVERHAFVAPGARLAGRVVVEEGAFVGIGASVRQGIRIGRWSTVGAGAAVVDDVASSSLVVGVPARVAAPVTIGAPEPR
ncbi:MAG TPA: acetyltransferase [Candidatus Limnocylindrales bacterium]|nr:acetyltransferase [Candidatus Limnocylindrales bacterium]